MQQQVQFLDLGLIDYKKCWDKQEQLFREIVNQKIEARKSPETVDIPNKHYLIFCEHPHVYTLGKSGNMSNLLVDQNELQDEEADFYKINRGGDITYHGPGQIVGYPILDLDHFFTDIHKYLRYLEEAVIRTLADYNIMARRKEGLTGVWLDANEPQNARKICAIGVRTSRWVTMHGFAFNVNTKLDYFENIIPCGINECTVTSMQNELEAEQNMEEVKERLKSHLSDVFEMLLIPSEIQHQ